MNNSTGEAKMLEWIPVVLGAVLAMLHIRRAISKRTLPLFVCVCALASTVLSGEAIEAPWLVFADAAFVLAGFAASHAVHALMKRQTRVTS